MARQSPNARVQLQGVFPCRHRDLDANIPDAGTQSDAVRPCLLQQVVRCPREGQHRQTTWPTPRPLGTPRPRTRPGVLSSTITLSPGRPDAPPVSGPARARAAAPQIDPGPTLFSAPGAPSPALPGPRSSRPAALHPEPGTRLGDLSVAVPPQGHLTLGFCCGGLSHVTLGMLGWKYLTLGAQPNGSQFRPRLQQPVVSQHAR